jgi:hypothetical protein
MISFVGESTYSAYFIYSLESFDRLTEEFHRTHQNRWDGASTTVLSALFAFSLYPIFPISSSSAEDLNLSPVVFFKTGTVTATIPLMTGSCQQNELSEGTAPQLIETEAERESTLSSKVFLHLHHHCSPQKLRPPNRHRCCSPSMTRSFLCVHVVG